MDNDALWTALPVPALVIDGNDNIAQVNSAGEFFLNASQRSLVGKSVYAKLDIEANLIATLARVRRDQGPMFINNVDVGRALHDPVECNIQLAPAGEAGAVPAASPIAVPTPTRAMRCGGPSGVRRVTTSARRRRG